MTNFSAISHVLMVLQTWWTSDGQQCTYQQFIPIGRSMTIHNPNYPNSYDFQSSQVWCASTATDGQLRLSCSDVDMPQAGSCIDTLAVSTTGDLTEAQEYCTDFTVVGSNMKVQLHSRTWWGGTFTCKFTAVRATEVATPGQCRCGWAFRTRIVGGGEAGVNEFPSMAALIYVTPGAGGSHRCGATIIASSAAITAAHCVDTVPPNELGLLVGDHDLSTGKETTATRLYRVSRTIIRDGFDLSKGTNDIALVITTTPIQFGPRVGPACLPFNIGGNLEYEHVTVAGWGLMTFGGKKPTVLRKTSLQIIPNSHCEKSYPDKTVTSNVLCTYKEGKDTCQFDSGGPLYFMDPRTNLMNVVGVVNYGRQCGSNSPAVNARVSEYLDWIKTKLPGDSLCVK